MLLALRKPYWLALLFTLIAFLPLSATTGQRLGSPDSTEPQVFSGRVLVEIQGDHKLVAAVDAYEGLSLADGWLDRVLVFVSQDPLEPLSYDGFGMVRVEERHATLILPEIEQILVLSLAGDPPVEKPVSEHGTVSALSQGVALVTSHPGQRQTLSEALAEERTRQRVRPVTERFFQQDPGGEEGGGETCSSSCSTTCTDGSSCQTSCTSSQCAECDCPASCYCRTRTGV